MMKLILPTHLYRLANTGREVEIQVEGPQTLNSALDALEAQFPMLRGTIRDHVSKQRRPFVRYFVCGEDWSFEDSDTILPEEITSGTQPLRIVGAMAGG